MKGNVTLWTARLKPRYVKIDVDFHSGPEAGRQLTRYVRGATLGRAARVSA
jgi:hypothetical protein